MFRSGRGFMRNGHAIEYAFDLAQRRKRMKAALANCSHDASRQCGAAVADWLFRLFRKLCALSQNPFSSMVFGGEGDRLANVLRNHHASPKIIIMIIFSR